MLKARKWAAGPASDDIGQHHNRGRSAGGLFGLDCSSVGLRDVYSLDVGVFRLSV